MLHVLYKMFYCPNIPVSTNTLYNTTTEPSVVHPAVFEAIDATTIKTAALRTDGAAGPSGIDVRGWRRLGASLHSASTDLCHSLALLVSLDGLAAFLGCWLIALDKSPGVDLHPIEIGEIPRRSVAKAVLLLVGISRRLLVPFNFAQARPLT